MGRALDRFAGLPALLGDRRLAGEPAENRAEDRVAPRRLGEGAGILEQRRNPRLSARRVVPVDEVAERVEREVLGEREAHGEPARVRPQPATKLVEGEAEDGAVGRVEQRSR